MSEKRFTFEYDDGQWGVPLFYDDGKKLCFDDVVDLLNELSDENNILNKNEDDLKECTIENIKLKEENEQLRKRLKGDNYMMVSEMVSNLRKTDICDGCKNKDKPVEWYMERGFSITGRVCDRYEPED